VLLSHKIEDLGLCCFWKPPVCGVDFLERNRRACGKQKVINKTAVKQCRKLTVWVYFSVQIVAEYVLRSLKCKKSTWAPLAGLGNIAASRA